MLQKTRFSKHFIAATEQIGDFDNPIPAPCFRRLFSLSDQPKRAEIYICGLGFYRLFLNGKEITKGKLAPYISNPDEMLYYDQYDILPYLQRGENVIGILLGNGLLNNPGGNVWCFDKAAYRSAPKFAISCFMDGKLYFEADKEFLTAESPIVFNDYRAGESFDARKDLGKWTTVGYNDEAWKEPICAETPSGEQRIPDCEPIRVRKEIKPKKIEKTANGYIYDFGVNTAGVCRLRIKNTLRGQTVVLTHGEIKREGSVYIDNICFPDKTRKDIFYKNTYICKGEKTETYEPSFVYYGFQYVQVEGITEEQATEDLLTMLVISSDVKSAGEFVCSDPIVNKIQNAVLNSTLSNMHYFPTDCPTREKNGWSGDVALSVEHILMNFKAERTLREWLLNFIKEQKEDGMLPSIIPNSGWGYSKSHGPSWDTALSYVCYELYRVTGNVGILTECEKALDRYLDWIAKQRNEDGLFDFGLGDWCPVGRGVTTYTAKREITSSVSVFEIAWKTAHIFEILGKDRQRKKAEKLAKEVRTSLRKKYVRDQRLLPEYVTQTAYSMCLDSGIFTEAEKKTAVQDLVAYIEANGKAMDVGCLGHKRLFRVLADNGYAELAFDMLRGPKFPSYGYYVERGMTSLYELFQELEEDSFKPKNGKGTSLNHHFFGDVSAWFKQYLSGIRINPDCNDVNHVVFDFCFIKQLDFVKGSYEHPLGRIQTEWRRKQGKIEVKITVPKGITYSVKNTADQKSNIKININVK